MTGRRFRSCSCGGHYRRRYGVTGDGDRMRWLECMSCGREAFYFVEQVTSDGHLFWYALEQAEGVERMLGPGFASFVEERSPGRPRQGSRHV